MFSMKVVEIHKVQGEYFAKFPHDNWSNRILLSLADNEEFKSFILKDYISANQKFFDLKEIRHKKLDNGLIVVDGSEIFYLANDNVFSGEVMLVSESFSSLSSKPWITLSSLPNDFLLKIKEKEVEIIYRNPTYSLKIISFLLLRKIGIIPSNFHVDMMYPELFGTIHSDSTVTKVEMVKFSRYILPHKIVFSILVTSDGNKNYYMLNFSRNKWRVKSANSQEGAVNILHKFLLKIHKEFVRFVEKLFDRWKWLEKAWHIGVGVVRYISETKFLKFALLLFCVGILVYLASRSSVFLALLTLGLIYALGVRLMLYINFRGRIV